MREAVTVFQPQGFNKLFAALNLRNTGTVPPHSGHKSACESHECY
jgi:hypothetical protein